MPDEPAVQTPPAPPAPAAPELTGPWAADLRASFTDPTVAAQVDQFLRSKVQPRVTQLEQQYAQTEDSRNLWEAIQSDPVGTYRAIERQLRDAGYSLEEAQAAAASATQTPPPPPAQPDPTTSLTPEEVQAWREQQQLSAYDAEIERIVNDPANKDVNPNLLHPFVAAAGGSFEQGVEMYRQHIAATLTQYGIDPATATPQQEQAAAGVAADAQAEANAAPPVMGQGAGGAAPASTPMQPDYKAEGLSPRDALHRSIENATASMSRNGQPAPPVS